MQTNQHLIDTKNFIIDKISLLTDENESVDLKHESMEIYYTLACTPELLLTRNEILLYSYYHPIKLEDLIAVLIKMMEIMSSTVN
jgi:hypothetical protein